MKPPLAGATRGAEGATKQSGTTALPLPAARGNKGGSTAEVIAGCGGELGVGIGEGKEREYVNDRLTPRDRRRERGKEKI